MEGRNTFDADVLKKHLATIDSADSALATLQANYRNDCKGPRSRIKNAWKLAKEQGLNVEALREVTTEHRAQRKHEARLAAMEDDDRRDFEEMVEALGGLADLPLGEAAKAAHPRGRADEEALNSLGRGS